MWFVVGLGNPGPKYRGTRHNVGFEVVTRLLDDNSFPPLRRFEKAAMSKGRIGKEEVSLVLPRTYMNMSGEAVGPIVRYYRADTDRVIVVHDDLDFEPGQVRVKRGGGHGGHKGVQSVMQHVGPEFVRVRMGIGKPVGVMDGADYVLSGFDARSRQTMDEAVGEAARAVTTIVERGCAKAMAEFNRRPRREVEGGDGDADREPTAE